MELIAIILRTFFEAYDLDPASITEMEISSQKMSDRWMNFYIHVEPEQPWFVIVSFFHGQWMAEQHNYIVA